MKRRFQTVLTLCLAALLAACSLISTPEAEIPQPTQVSQETAVQPPATATVEAPPTQTPAPGLVLSVKEIHEKSEEAPHYEIDVRWPYLEWGSDPRVEAFNQAAEKIALDEIEAFKKGAADTIYGNTAEPWFSTLQIDFTPTIDRNGVFAVLFKISYYMAGAAHPGHYSYSLNYDLHEGRVLALSDLFQPDTDYLEAISAYCMNDLKTRGRLEWEEGAVPTPENYRVWNITPDGLLITFDEYQVAPYAAGPQAVMVPYDQLPGLIRPEGY